MWRYPNIDNRNNGKNTQRKNVTPNFSVEQSTFNWWGEAPHFPFEKSGCTEAESDHLDKSSLERISKTDYGK